MANTSPTLELENWTVVYDQPPKFHPFWFEKADIQWWKVFMLQYHNLPWYVCAVYLATIFGLKAFLKNRKAVKVQKLLIIWNTCLAVFSTVGFFRIGQELFNNLAKPEGYYGTVCIRKGRNFTTDFWLLLFGLSKFVELGDSVFIVLRKQPLHVLQWYHHALVTIVAWKLFPWSEPIVLYYAVINFGVHSLMYSYFAAKGLGFRIPESFAMALTTIQILQMVVNTGQNVYTVVISQLGYSCNRHPSSILWSFITYVSLWAMFVKFFRTRYSGYKKKIN